VSQLFDSLRRGRMASDRSSSTRTARGDAVLTTLGYTPSRNRGGRPSAVMAVLLLLGLAGAVWLGWYKYMGDVAGPDTARRAPAPSPPKFTPSARASSGQPALPEAPPSGRSSASADATVPRQPAAPPLTAEPSPRSTSRASSLPASHSERTTSVVPANNDLELAIHYHRAGDFEHALQRYRALLERNELDAQTHNNLGLLYQEKGLLTESAGELQRAVVIEPRNAGTHNNYGVTLLLLGRTDQAVAEFQSALKMEPGNLDARVNLALAERTSGQLDLAKESLLDVLNRAPRNAPAHYNLAQLYDQTNEPARAVEHYRMFLENAGAEHADRAATVRARIAALSKSPE
jgi:Tfp pilus assembly protein PilF